MIFKINEKYYCFDLKDKPEYSRMFEHGGEYFVCNAPKEMPDKEVIKKINGGYVGETEVVDGVERIIPGTGFSWMSVPKDNLGKYEVAALAIFEFDGKKYCFGDDGKRAYTRAFKRSGEIFVCNAPEELSDERVIQIIDGSGAPRDWGYMSIPKDKLHKYELAE